MKRGFFASLAAAALVAAALVAAAQGQTSETYLNQGVVLCPPGTPPVVDAINFVNDSGSVFDITFTTLDLDGDTLTYYPIMFSPMDTLNFTNLGTMAVNAGINFMTFPSGTGPEEMAANFYNSGAIYAGTGTNLTLVGTNAVAVNNAAFFGGLPQMRVAASNIFNPGIILVGYDGFCSMSGNLVDLSRGSLLMSTSSVSAYVTSANGSFSFLPQFGAGVYAGYWGIGTNVLDPLSQFQFPGPPQTPISFCTPRAAGAGYGYFPVFQELVLDPDGLTYGLADQINGSNIFYTAVFVNNTNSAFAPKVYIDYVPAFGYVPGLVGLEWTDTNNLGVVTAYLDLLDDRPLVVPTNIFDGDLGYNTVVPTFIPNNYQVYEQDNFSIGLGLGAYDTPGALPFSFPDGDVTNVWAAFEALLPPISAILSDSPFENVTNVPGRMVIAGGGALDLNLAQVSSQNYLLLQCTNQFLGSKGASIAAPYADVLLRSTNGLLEITNLVSPVIYRPEGYIAMWSTAFTNVVNSITNEYHVLFVDAHVAPTVPARSQTLYLVCTNALGGDDELIIHDIFHVTSELLLSATRLTLATNAPGGPTPYGAIYMDSSSIIWSTATPRVEYLTNYGVISAQNAVFFGGSRSSPYVGSNPDQPYVAMVNRGFITNYGTLAWASDFENDGVIEALSGDVQIQQAQNVILTNGQSFAGEGSQGLNLAALDGTIAIGSGYLFASNTLFQAGGGISLDITNAMTDGISNLALIYLANPEYPTNFYNAQLTNGNYWSCGNPGLSLAVKPGAGDLLGTTISNAADAYRNVPIVWAAEDRGASPDGYLNNAALGRLILSGGQNSVYTFTGAGPGGNAMYIDDLELESFTATDTDAAGNFTGLTASNITVYFAQARGANGEEIAEKLDGSSGGSFIWVSNYNWGYFSSTNLLYPDGLLHRVNTALATSCDLVSNPTNEPPVVNCENPVPIVPVPLPEPGLSNDVPLLPAIVVPPQPQTVLQGETVVFTASASSADPLTYQWELNGVPIPGQTGPTLVLPNVTAANDGQYSVVVRSFAGAVVSQTATLTVNVLPAITGQPQSQSVAPGGTAVFTVVATSPTPLTYQWLFDGSNIVGATRSVYALADVQDTNSGLYSVVVSNPFASVTSAAASLEVAAAVEPPAATLSTQAAWADSFAAAVGNYSGLFSDTNGASAASSGSFSAKVSKGGVYTAKVTLGTKTYSSSGTFSTSTPSTSTVTISRGSALTPLTLTMRLDLGSGGQMLGAVATPGWSAAMRAYRSASAVPATYTLVIPPGQSASGAASPSGYGSGTITVDNSGNFKLAGVLADGAPISQSATRSQQGYWPLYASLYSGNGCALSWLKFATTPTSACGGQLVWLNAAGASSPSYPAGFTNQNAATGFAYSPAQALAGITGGTLTLYNSAGAQVSTAAFTLDSKKHVHPVSKSSALNLSFVTSSGVFKGSVWSAALNRTLNFQGVLCGQGANGCGHFFVSPEQSGKVLLELTQ